MPSTRCSFYSIGTEYPFLQGRAFVFASQYAKLLPLQLAGQYLEAAIHVIEASEPGIPVKISAVKAIHKYEGVSFMCGNADFLSVDSFCQGGEESAIEPFVVRIAKDLGPFLMMTSEDTLTLVLETLSVILQVAKGSWVTPDLADSIVIAMIEVWSKNNKG